MKTERHYDFHVGNEVFESGTHIMAILNVTPDSFYAGSRHAHDAVETAKKFLEHGAEIIDIGGQSTRPGAQSVSALEEMSRVLPAVESIKKSSVRTRERRYVLSRRCASRNRRGRGYDKRRELFARQKSCKGSRAKTTLRFALCTTDASQGYPTCFSTRKRDL